MLHSLYNAISLPRSSSSSASALIPLLSPLCSLARNISVNLLSNQSTTPPWHVCSLFVTLSHCSLSNTTCIQIQHQIQHQSTPNAPFHYIHIPLSCQIPCPSVCVTTIPTTLSIYTLYALNGHNLNSRSFTCLHQSYTHLTCNALTHLFRSLVRSPVLR